jgi:hypothetical protein
MDGAFYSFVGSLFSYYWFLLVLENKLDSIYLVYGSETGALIVTDEAFVV